MKVSMLRISAAAIAVAVAAVFVALTTTISAATNTLTGIGALKATFTKVHGLSLGGCPAKTCFGPKINTGAGSPYQFQIVTFGEGVVDGYTQAFARGSSIDSAEHQALVAFPADTKVSSTGLISHDSQGESCRWMDVTSTTLGKIFYNPKITKQQAAILGPPTNFSIEFATSDSAGNWTYNASDIDQAIVGAGWVIPSNGC